MCGLYDTATWRSREFRQVAPVIISTAKPAVRDGGDSKLVGHQLECYLVFHVIPDFNFFESFTSLNTKCSPGTSNPARMTDVQPLIG